MMKYIYLAFALLFFGVATAQDTPPPAVETDYSSQLKILSGETEHPFLVEIADTRATITQGMMHRPEMAADVGMLFIREEARFDGFWMKNTLVSLDILFLADDGKIMSIAHNAVPMSERNIAPGVAVRYILELKGGQAEILGIKPGDIVRHERLGNNG